MEKPGARSCSALFLLVSAFAASGCMVSSARGALLRSTPLPERCYDTQLRGTLTREDQSLRLSLTGDETCNQLEAREYQVERVSTPGTVLSVGVGILAGAAVGVPAVIGLGAALGPGSTDDASTNALSMLALIPAAGVGTAAAAAVGAIKTRLPDETERVEAVTGSLSKGQHAPSGTLRAEDDPHSWKVEGGQVLLPVGDLSGVRLNRLLLNGQLVEFSGESARRADALDACRRAVKGWTPTEACPEVLRRADAATSCAEFWGSARDLLERVHACTP